MTQHPYQLPSGPAYFSGPPVYGGHSPGPRPNFYPYPPQPHITSHHTSPQYPHPPSRGNHRGGHVNSSYGSRGSHYTYHPTPQAPPYHHSLNSPVNGPTLSPHPGQHVSYSPQSSKYNSSYSYHYPSPNAPVFTPSWQTQSPISPLPKQLSMPVPSNVRAYYDSSQVPSSQPSPTHQSLPVSPPQEPLRDTSSTPAPTTPDITPTTREPTRSPVETAPVLPTEVSETPLHPEVQASSVQPQSSLYSQTGTIHTSEVPGHLSTAPASRPVAHWVIWSRRPQHPSQAPGIIISPKARPPLDVIQQALDLNTPPPSPPPSLSPAPSQSSVTPVVPADGTTLKLSFDEAANSLTNSTVPSSAATESEETPTVPGSPVSSYTSVSVVGTPGKDLTEVQPAVAEAEVVPITPAPTTLLTVDPVVATSSPDIALTPVETAETETQVTSTEDRTPPQPIIADTPSTPPPKKSWASLLRNPASSASAANSLPTSSVVGVSIPAAPQTPVSVSLSRKSELLNLLSSFPAPTTVGPAAASISIRPRGLINNGNMCFANSVLQVLVYCPPFRRLFVELGRLLAPDGINSKDKPTNNANKGQANGSTLINATASFLQEFLDPSEKNRTDSGARTGINNSSGSAVKGSGKGKEKEFKDENTVGDNWDESFLPNYVYDVIKTKKRFDTMRVGYIQFDPSGKTLTTLNLGRSSRGRRRIPWVLFGRSRGRDAFYSPFNKSTEAKQGWVNCVCGSHASFRRWLVRGRKTESDIDYTDGKCLV